MFQGVQRVWSRMFGRYLWLTNTVSGGVIFAVGDGIQQQLEHARCVGTKRSYDWGRTGRLFLVGVINGPPHHVFYVWLDKILPHKTGKVVFKKIMADQIVAAPFFAVSFFLSAGLLEGHTLAESWQECKRKFLAVYAFDWFLWPPAQAINFYLVPTRYRVLYINFVTLLWDIFLSYMKHREQVREITAKVEF